jgi:hypothetical protein
MHAHFGIPVEGLQRLIAGPDRVDIAGLARGAEALAVRGIARHDASKARTYGFH